MVKIENQFGDVKTGKQGAAVYQRVHGKQVRRRYQPHKNADTVMQQKQRARFTKGIDFWNSLTVAEKRFLKSYMETAGITAPDGHETTLYSFVKKIAMTVPEVEMETEAGEGGFTGTYAAWSYRKPITLNNGGSELSNYQVLITLTTGNFDYSKCNEDGSDIRFAASDKTTALPYWIQEWNYNGTSKIWVKVDSIPTGENVCLYIYYGNASAESESNGDNTFLIFDDFEGTAGADPDTSKWLIEKKGSASAVVELDGNGALHLAGEPGIISSGNVKSITQLPDNNFLIRIKRKANNEYYRDATIGTGDIIGLGGETNWWHTTLYNGYIFLVQDNLPGNRNHLRMDDGEKTILPNSGNAPSLDVWHNEEHSYLSDGTLESKFDGANSISNTDTTHLTLAKYLLLSQGEYTTGYGGDTYIDQVLVRKYVTSGPTVESLGTEETGGAGTKLKALSIRHPAIKSYELVDTGIKEDGLSDLENRLSTSVLLPDLDHPATSIKVVTLAGQEYSFPVQ